MSLVKSLAGNEICDQTARDSFNKIGSGRNLILKSGAWDEWGSQANGISVSYDGGIMKIVSSAGNGNWKSWNKSNVIEDNMNDGDDFTFSIEIKSDDGTVPPMIYFKSGMGYYEMNGTVSKDYTWCSYTGKWKKENGIAFHFGWSGRNGTYCIRKIKFEKGICATDWVPALEDSLAMKDDGNGNVTMSII